MTGQTDRGEPACLYPVYREALPDGRTYQVIDQVSNPRVDEIAPIRIPAGHVFLVGDNRDDSLDSRFTVREGGIGFVPVENLIGRASFIFWSTNGTAEYAKPWTWFTALRGARIASGFNGKGQ
jgi:signal peptidase I